MMQPNATHLIIHRIPWMFDKYAVMLAKTDNNFSEPKFSMAKEIIWEEMTSSNAAGTPMFELFKEQAQEIFNQLWREGFRPADGTGNAGHTAAIQYHLEDMRKLVFITEGKTNDAT